MSNERWTRRSRRAAYLCIAGSATLLLGAAPSGTITGVSTCHCTGSSYAGSSTNPVPIFTGSNRLRIRGGNVLLATSVLVDGIGPGNIVARRSGELDVTVVVPPGSAQTIRLVRVKYPIGEDVFRARVIPRGTVGRIEELPAEVTVNRAAWIRFSGSEIYDAVLQPTDYFKEATSGATSSATTLRTQIIFTKCGSFPVYPRHLRHQDAPAGEVSNGNASYLGSTSKGVKVVGCGSTEPVCTTNTSVSAPVFSKPTSGQTFYFAQGTRAGNVAIAWVLGLNQTAPNGEYIVTRQTGSATPITQTMKATSVTYSFAVPGDHTVKVRARNCGQPAPESTIRFQTRIQ